MPGTITENAKVIRPVTITESLLTSTNVTDATAEYLDATTYNIGDLVKVTAVAAPTPTIDTQKIYRAVTGSNQGNDPTTDTAETNWEEVSSTNDFKMFDLIPQDQSSRADSIAVTITPGQAVNAFSLINVSAAEAVVVMTSAKGDGEVYNETHSLIDDSFIGDWYEYFFEPVRYVGDYAVTGLPNYDDCIVTVTLNDTGNTVLCGALVLGAFAELGWTQHGSSYSLIDYSTINIDTDGRFTIVAGSYNKRANASIFCETRLWSGVQGILLDLRNTPAVWIGDESVSGSVIFGYYREYIINVDNPALTRVELTIQGLSAT